jgi:hypothetical protein
MDEAEHLLQQLAQIRHDGPPSLRWSEALPRLRRFAINPLRSQLAGVTWITRMQALAREAIRASLGTSNQLKQFCFELGEIGLESEDEISTTACPSLIQIMHFLQGWKTEDVDFVTMVMAALSVESGLRFRSAHQLIRATSLLHEMFMVIRENTFKHHVLQVQERHGILCFVDNDCSRDANVGNFLFRTLPKGMAEDEQDRTALLMYSECRQFVLDVIPQIHDLIGSK